MWVISGVLTHNSLGDGIMRVPSSVGEKYILDHGDYCKNLSSGFTTFTSSAPVVKLYSRIMWEISTILLHSFIQQ